MRVAVIVMNYHASAVLLLVAAGVSVIAAAAAGVSVIGEAVTSDHTAATGVPVIGEAVNSDSTTVTGFPAIGEAVNSDSTAATGVPVIGEVVNIDRSTAAGEAVNSESTTTESNEAVAGPAGVVLTREAWDSDNNSSDWREEVGTGVVEQPNIRKGEETVGVSESGEGFSAEWRIEVGLGVEVMGGPGNSSAEWRVEDTTDDSVVEDTLESNNTSAEWRIEVGLGVEVMEGPGNSSAEWRVEDTTDDSVVEDTLESDNTSAEWRIEVGPGVEVMGGPGNSSAEWRVEDTTDDSVVGDTLESDNTSAEWRIEVGPGVEVMGGPGNSSAEWRVEDTTDDSVVGDTLESDNTSAEWRIEVGPGVEVMGGPGNSSAEWRVEDTTDDSVVGDTLESDNTSAEWRIEVGPGVEVMGGPGNSSAEWRVEDTTDDSVVEETLESDNTSAEWRIEVGPGVEVMGGPGNSSAEWRVEDTTDDSVVEDTLESDNTSAEWRIEVGPGVEVMGGPGNSSAEWRVEDTTDDSVVEDTSESDNTSAEWRIEVGPGVEVMGGPGNEWRFDDTTDDSVTEDNTSADRAGGETTLFEDYVNDGDGESALSDMTHDSSTHGSELQEIISSSVSASTNEEEHYEGTTLSTTKTSPLAIPIGVDESKNASEVDPAEEISSAKTGGDDDPTTETSGQRGDTLYPQISPAARFTNDVFDEGMDQKRALMRLSEGFYDELPIDILSSTEESTSSTNRPATNLNQPKESNQNRIDKTFEVLILEKILNTVPIRKEIDNENYTTKRIDDIHFSNMVDAGPPTVEGTTKTTTSNVDQPVEMPVETEDLETNITNSLEGLSPTVDEASSQHSSSDVFENGANFEDTRQHDEFSQQVQDGQTERYRLNYQSGVVEDSGPVQDRQTGRYQMNHQSGVVEDSGPVQDKQTDRHQTRYQSSQQDSRLEDNYQKDTTSNKIPRPAPTNGRTEGPVTLAFVFDSTGSMWDDLVQVKSGSQLIMEAMLEREDKPIHNYVLVPFHDPGIGPVTDTTDHQRFRQSLQNITVYGGGDCPEMSVGAIKQALEVSLPNSYIYVFTDATAKDFRLLPDVLKLIQRKKSQVVFVMTGDCGDNKQINYQVYEKIAATSSGQVFHLNKTNVKEVMDFVKSSLQSGQVNLLAVDKPSASTDELALMVDESLQEFTVSVSGLNPQIDVTDPAGHAVDQPPQLTPLLSLENVKVVNVQEPGPGQWTVTVTSDSSHSVRSTGRSDFDFTHGFAVVVTDKMAESFYRPLRGSRNSILIQASSMESLANLTTVKIVDLKGKEVESLPLYPVRGTSGLYRGKLFVPNNDFFYLAVEGFGHDGSPVKRISSTAISSQTPEPPIVHMVPTLTTRVKSPTTLSCYVESLVPFTVAWFKNGVPVNPSKQYKQSAEVVWHMKSTSPDAEGNYTCQANNLVGRQAESTILTVTGPPPSVETDSKVFVKPNGVAIMNCVVQSDLEFSSSWDQETISIAAEAAGKNDTVLIPLQNNFKTKMLPNGSLEIRYVSTADEGWYVCSAENKGGRNHSRVYLAVNEPVQVKVSPGVFEFRHGDTFTVTCAFTGRPEPRVRWLKDGRDIQGQDGNRRADYIEQRHGLDLRVTQADEEDEGVYQCVAENGVDRDEGAAEGRLVEAPTAKAEEGMVLVRAGEDARLSCVITGRPPPVVTWWRDDKEIGADSKHQVLEDGSLRVISVEMLDKGDFTCFAENQLGSEKDFVQLEVGTAPLIARTSTDPVSADIGTTGRLPCAASGYPEPTVSWARVNATRVLSERFDTTDLGSLLISGVSIADEGTYVCTAENTFGTDEATTELRVTGIVKPVLDASSLLSPETRIVRGERLELPCRLSLGNPPPEVTWYRDGEVLESDQMAREGMEVAGDLLLVSYTQREHRGLYECVASNVGGTASQATAVTVLEPPSFEESDEKVFKVLAGESLRIPCEAGGFPKPFVTWEKDRMPLLPGQTVFKSQDDNSLMITEASEEDTGTYVCTAENAAGKKQKAVVIVVQVPPIVLETSDPVSASEGSLVTLECVVYAAPEARISWYRDDILVSSYRKDVEFLDKGAGIRFVANISDSGSYKCVAMNEAGMSSAILPLTVMVPPSIHPPQDERHRVTSGQNVTFNCHVSGYPAPRVAWTLNGAPLDRGADGELVLVGVAQGDAGHYVCDAENDVGITQKIFYLQVNVPPKILEELPTKVKLMEGEDYSIPCTASGIPTPTVSWRRDGKPLGAASTTDDTLVLEDGTLVLVNVSDFSTGMYTCTGENGEGSDQKNYIVQVLVPPTMPHLGETKLDVAEGGHVVMTCPSVDAIPAPHYKWMKGDRLIGPQKDLALTEDGRTLTLRNARPGDAGRYTCIATNLAGRDKATFKLGVRVLPHFRQTSYKRERRVVEGNKVELKCAALGQPTPRISWKKNNIPVTPHTTPGVVLSPDKQTLYIHKARLHDAGLYQCAVSNLVGRRDRDFHLTVLVPPELEGASEEQVESVKGRTVMLQCPMTGTPEPTIRWRKLGEHSEIRESKNIILSVDKKMLEISSARSKDEGAYVCEAISEAGASEKRFNVTVLEPPFINQGDFTEELKVAEGKHARLTCRTRARPHADVVWLHNGHMMDADNDVGAPSGRLAQTRSTADEHVLSIDDVRVSDAGKYTCLASNEVGVAEKNYRLKVLVAPRLARTRSNEPNTIESIEGLPITIRCPVEGHSTVDIHWLKDSQPLEAGNMLRISNSRPEDAGNYTCVAGNTAGSVSTSFQLDVLVPPSPNDKKETEDVFKLTINDTLRLVCNVSGHPPPNIVWLKGVTPISSLKWLNAKFEDFNRTLIVQHVTREHGGRYSCLAINMAGTTEIVFDVQVQEPPKMDVDTAQMISNHTVKLHRRLVLKCPLSGLPQPNITWYKDGLPVKSGNNVHLSSDGKQLHLMQALTKNAGEYDCVAENTAGTKKLHFNVDVVVPAEWSDWSDWSECSAICGTGEQVRVRFCNSAERSGRTESCQGESEEWRECKMGECQIDGAWGSWSEWTSCSESCGRATRRRYRKCDNPRPAYGGQPCLGSDGQQEYCSMPPCPVDGKWSHWTDWSDCSASCGRGTKQRSRRCNSPTPAYNGDACNGPEVETLDCNLNRCPQHGQWAAWGSWTPCSTTCGPGIKKRHRMCSDPPPKYGGGPCAGENLQIDKCITKSCDKVPLSASLHVRGNLNGEKLSNKVIAARISDFGPKRTVYASIDDILKDQPGWFPYLAFLLSPVSWNTAYEMDLANNGYSLTNGNFRQQSQVEFATGHQMVLRHVGRGLDDDGALQVDIEVEGNVPIVQPEANVLIEPFEEDYVQTGPNSLYVSASNSIKINGRKLPYTWNNSVSYDDMQGTMPYLVEKLTTSDIDAEYDSRLQQLKYVMSTEIGRKYDNNRCLEGFESEGLSPYCNDVDECADVRTHQCHVTQTCENLLGSYRCYCQPGFKSAGVGQRCLDINECVQDTNLCSHECLNIRGSYQCMCPPGLSLLADGKTCSDRGSNKYWESSASDLYSVAPDPRRQMYSRDRGTSYFEHSQPSSRYSGLTGSEAWSCPSGFQAVNGICLDDDECVRMPSVCNSEQTCLNVRGTYKCLETPCPSDFVKNLATGSCVKRCDRPGVYCSDGALISQTLSYNILELDSDSVEPYEDLMELNAQHQNARQLHKARYRIIENEKGKPFRVRQENGQGLLYTQKQLLPGRIYRITVLALTYEESGKNVLYTKRFIIYIHLSND